MEIKDIPSSLLTESVRELIVEINALEQKFYKLGNESTSSFYAFEVQEVQAELEDLRSDLELELTIARSFRRGYRRPKKVVPPTPATAG
jgi:hypothetical protein